MRWDRVGLLIIIGLGLYWLAQMQSKETTEAVAVSSSPSSPSVVVPLTEDQRKFAQAIAQAKAAFAAAPNDLAAGGVRAARRSAVCEVLPSSLRVQDWGGRIATLSSNSDGMGVFGVTFLGVGLATWNNSLSDMDGSTMIDPTSPLFQKLSTMKVGTTVKFSGSFFRSAVDCAREKSLTLRGSMTDPDYLFRFTSVDEVTDAPGSISPPAKVRVETNWPDPNKVALPTSGSQ